MRSMKTTTGATDNEITHDPINERLSVESASDDEETYEMRFKQHRGKASFGATDGLGKSSKTLDKRAQEWELKFKKQNELSINDAAVIE